MLLSIPRKMPNCSTSPNARDGAGGVTFTPKSRDEMALAICEAVIDLAAALFNVPSKELRRPGRSPAGISRVRQVAMYVCNVTLSLTMTEIGRGFNRDRTTVLHACQVVEDMRDDDEFDDVVATMERVVRAAFANQLDSEEIE